jgi:hypothetical protein
MKSDSASSCSRLHNSGSKWRPLRPGRLAEHPADMGRRRAKGEAAVAVLRETLEDDGPLVREHAVWALPPSVVDGGRPRSPR